VRVPFEKLGKNFCQKAKKVAKTEIKALKGYLNNLETCILEKYKS